MKADAHSPKETPTSRIKRRADTAGGLEVFGSALAEIGWQLALGVVGPLWLVSRYKQAWLDSSWFALIIIWIVFVFVSVVYIQLKKLPKKYGGL